MLYRVSDSTDTHVCGECGHDVLIIDPELAEIVCTRCGVTISESNRKVVTMMPRFSSSLNEEYLVPLNPIIADWGLSTNIGWQNTDHYGNKLRNETRLKLRRLRKWNNRLKVNHSKEQNLKKALRLLNDLGADLKLPKNVLDTSAIIYRKALKNNLMHSHNILYTVAGSMYVACRQCQVLRTLSEISESSGVPVRKLSKYYKLLYDRLELKVGSYPKTIYINRLASRLGLLAPVEKLALKILEEADNNLYIQGCRPESVAAACIYISIKHFGENITQGIMAENANTTEVTLRNRYKSLLKRILIESYI